MRRPKGSDLIAEGGDAGKSAFEPRDNG